MFSSESSIQSTLGFKFPNLRTYQLRTGQRWLDGKRIDDNIGDYWRIHDGLYDLKDFQNHHPGGKDWIKLTQGTDITEAFETHHLKGLAEKLLPKYFVKKTDSIRNSPFTFHENGFYRTLKRRIIEEIPKLPKSPVNRSKLMLDSLLITFLTTALLAVYLKSFLLGFIAGITLSLTAIGAHNFFHRADNFRMHYFDFTFMKYKDWRISHAISHHLYTNTINDLEISALEPFVFYLPVKGKSLFKRYFPWFFSPILYCFIFYGEVTRSFLETIFFKKEFNYNVFLPLTLLVVMMGMTTDWMFGLLMFNFIIVIGSFHFGVVGVNAAHHHPEIFHDGDTARPKHELDWGVHQLDAVMDRRDITGSHFLVMTHFGDHALHHLFPTVDHGLLEFLYPAFLEVCDDFGVTWKMVSQLDLVKGQYQQISMKNPNEKPPPPLKVRR